jgi:hypothetical protein
MKQNGDEFSVEATPVVEIKRAPPQAGKAFENEKTEVYLEDEGGGGSAYLVDGSGEHHPITAFPFVMGRGNECDLVLTGKGISRKHAEIVFQSGRFVVNDLDSLNGLKVNGYKVARVILEENDSIKLGEATLTFTTSRQDQSSSKSAGKAASGKHQSGKKSAAEPDVGDLGDVAAHTVGPNGANPFSDGTSGAKKWIRLGLLAGTVVMAGAAAYVFLSGQPQTPAGAIVTPPQPSVSTASAEAAITPPTPAASATTAPGAAGPDVAMTGEGEVGSTPGALDDSGAAMSPAPGEPPFSPSPDVLSGVQPPPSIAMTAPAASQKITPPAPERNAAPRGQPSQAPVARTAPASTQKTAAAPRPTPAPAAALAPAQPSRPVQVASVNSVAAASPTGGNAVAKADAAYLAGNADAIIAELQKQASSGNSAAARAAASKRDQLLKAYNLFLTGKQASLEGDTRKALEFYERYLDAEKSLFGGKRSVYGKQAASKLMDTYVAVGNEAAQSKRSHEAYKAWQKALAYGDSVAARIAIDSSNQKARTLYRQALRLEYVNAERAKDLWRQVMNLVPPGSEYYNKANEKLTWYEKWGS